MEFLLVAILLAVTASLAVFLLGFGLASYRGRRSRRRLIPPGGDPGT